MSGAVVGGVVALVGWLGLFAYLVVVNGRLARAVSEAAAAPLVTPPTVTISDVEPADG